MAESAVTCLLNSFSSWLQYEQNLLGSLRPEVQLIFDELRRMRAFLRTADSKGQEDLQLNELMTLVRDIAYDVEDVLDQYKLQFLYPGANGFSARIKKIYGSIKGLNSQRQIASQIQEIKSRVVNASERYLIYKDMYPVIDQGETSYDGRGDALLLEDVDVVGIENPKKQLLEWLESTEGGLKVVSVVGMAGMGKTTLARKVYDDKSLKGNYFDHRVWVTVSESYEVEDLLARMIKLLVGEEKLPQCLESNNVAEMKQFIYEFLQDKAFVVVLDDIWKIDAWEAIKYAFPRSMTNSQGCIIITTRFKDIANVAGFDTKSLVYNLEPLKHEDAKELFYKKAFPRDSCPLYLKEISESILNRCEGLPLAIVVIGGLLATKNHNIQEWEMFNRSIGDELEGKRLNKLISLSFYDLPYYLKPCFLYLSIFPEDEEIDKPRLVQLWTAEGFVEEKQGKTVEEVAEGYINELVNRSLIQVVYTRMDGTPELFRIHDLLREYIISKARHENLIASDGGDKIRRITLDATSNNMQEANNFDHLRSLFWFGSSVVILRKVLSRRRELLKVLYLRRDLRQAPVEFIPDEVFKLYHLKYLNLSGIRIKHIPRSIKNLVNLETLDLFFTRVTKLPTEVAKLKKLRHLLVDSFDGSQGLNGIGSLASIQTLRYLSVDEVIEIGKLTQLRNLGLRNLKREDGKDLCSSLSKLNNLRELYLSSIEGVVIDLDLHPMSTSSLPFLQTLYLGVCLEKIPQWIPSLFGLTELYLSGRILRGNQDPLECIQGLPNLLSLRMCSANERDELIFKAGGFQRLKKLMLGWMRALRWVKVEEGCMPHLQELYMWNCKLTVEVPEGLLHLLHLQIVEFGQMNEDFVNRVADQKRRGKEWELGHVPEVNIQSMYPGPRRGRQS